MKKLLDNEQIAINNQILIALSGTVVFTPGTPEKMVTATQGETYVGSDHSTAKAKLEFELANTAENQDLINKFSSDFDQDGKLLAVRLMNSGAVIENAVITNSPSYSYSGEGNIPIVIEGDKSV